MRYGSHTSVECPTQHQEEAFDFLVEEFEKIDGVVRRVNNSHELGEYISFEVDLPEKFERVDGLDEEDEKNEMLLIEYEEWLSEANRIEEEYSNRYDEFL